MILGMMMRLAVAAEPDAIVGTWKTAETEKGYSHVEIEQVGGLFRGTIVWMKNPVYKVGDKGPVGEVKVDLNNPDPARRDDPVIGLTIARDFVFKGGDVWTGGTIYDPENGKTYSCRMTLVEPDRLAVRGYIGVTLIGRTSEWTRVP
jgi:uncharacterized protein (DUF2147 family)